MYCKVLPTLVLSSLVIPALSLAVPSRAELERRDLAASSVETLEAREPLTPFARKATNAISGAFGVADRVYRKYQAARQWRWQRRDLDAEDLEAREPSEFDELDARSFADVDDELVLRSLLDEMDEVDARSLYDELEDLEARDFMGETDIDELD